MYVFFALSGFLITAVLVDEHDLTGTIRLRRFFARRALRLLPGLSLFLACWLAADFAFGQHPWFTSVPGGGRGTPESPLVALQGIGGALGYVTNWLTIGHMYTSYVSIGHLWSLSVEEQLYAVWAPVLLLALGASKRRAELVALGVAVASITDVAILIAHNQTLWEYMGTDARASAFLLGGAFAIARSHGWLLPTKALPTDVVAAVSVLVLSAVSWSLSHSIDRLETLGAWVASTVACAALVGFVTVGGGRTARLLSGASLCYVGRRSYALYLWHYVWLTWFRSLGLTGVAIALVASFACAECSWRIVEWPSLRRKGHFASSAPALTTPVVEPETVRAA